MQNSEPSLPARAKRTARNLFFLIATLILVCFALAGAAFASLFILDPGPGDEGEQYTFSRRMKRYKVACQFIWYDLKDALARRSASGPHAVSCPAEPPESEPEQEP